MKRLTNSIKLGLDNSPTRVAEHHRRHLDFAKFLILLSVAFMTVVASSPDMAECMSWLMKIVLGLQLGSIFFGVLFFYTMLREAVTPVDPTLEQLHSMKEEGMPTYEKVCDRLEHYHERQVYSFVASFVLLVIALSFF